MQNIASLFLQLLIIILHMSKVHWLGILRNFTDGWMDDLRFYILFNSVSVISGQWEVDNERHWSSVYV